MSHLRFPFFLFLGLWGCVPTVQAQLTDPCGCDAGLGKVSVNSSEKTTLRHAYLAQMDRKQWDTVRQGGGGGVKLFGLFSIGGSYGQFHGNRREYLSRMNYRLDADQSRVLLYERIETADWRRCKEACFKQQPGFFCGVTILTKYYSAVQCSWRPEGHATQKTVSVMVNGAKKPSETITPNTSRDIHVKRDPGQTLLVTLTLEGGSSRTIKIPETPKIPTLPPPAKSEIVILAAQCVRGVNVALASPSDGSAAVYGDDVLLNAPPYNERYNKAEFDFDISKPARYLVKVEYASALSRPVRLHLDGKVVADSALWKTTGCWNPSCQRLLPQAQISLTQGSHTIKLERNGVFPHIRRIVLERLE